MRITIARRNFRMADEEMQKIEMKEAEKDDQQFRVRYTTYFFVLKCSILLSHFQRFVRNNYKKTIQEANDYMEWEDSRGTVETQV